MPNDINELDATDAGLKGIFGDRFHDETTEKPTAAKATPNTSDTNTATKTAHKPIKKPTVENVMDAEFQPVKPAPNFLDKLKASAKHIATFGGLNLLIFYWQQAELMDASIAIPCMWVCMALAGWGVGKNFAKGNR